MEGYTVQGAMTQQRLPEPEPEPRPKSVKEELRLLSRNRPLGRKYTKEARGMTRALVLTKLNLFKIYEEQEPERIQEIKIEVLQAHPDILEHFVGGWVIKTHIKEYLRNDKEHPKQTPPAVPDTMGTPDVELALPPLSPGSASRKPSSGSVRTKRTKKGRAGAPYKTPVKACSAPELFTNKPLDARRKRIASDGDVPSAVSMPVTGNILEGQRCSSPEASDDLGTSSVAMHAGYTATQPYTGSENPDWLQSSFGPLYADSQLRRMGETSLPPSRKPNLGDDVVLPGPGGFPYIDDYPTVSEQDPDTYLHRGTFNPGFGVVQLGPPYGDAETVRQSEGDGCINTYLLSL